MLCYGTKSINAGRTIYNKAVKMTLTLYPVLALEDFVKNLFDRQPKVLRTIKYLMVQVHAQTKFWESGVKQLIFPPSRVCLVTFRLLQLEFLLM